MTRLQLALELRHSVHGDVVRMGAIDVHTALAIADINVERGSAELWDGERRLGRLTKHGGDHATFWEIVPDQPRG
ncbi:hypothetical protein [Qipengyuania sphaerica]|uniref:hypothetical protein n=1 Tax=Qipengyuania sphaerica TaxID=2867243 RepID=UPI001C889540|nr:hypothetical protein [Qipengyuania sphaerica]MBX7539881.1 hypothetical protein [Qipengyuania sphaerica]